MIGKSGCRGGERREWRRSRRKKERRSRRQDSIRRSWRARVGQTAGWYVLVMLRFRASTTSLTHHASQASDGGVKGTIIRCSQCHEYHHLDCINRIRQQAGQDVLPVNTNFACYECITDKTRRPRSLGTVVESAQTLAQIKWAGESHLYDNQMATTGDLFNLVHSLKLLAGSAQGIEIVSWISYTLSLMGTDAFLLCRTTIQPICQCPSPRLDTCSHSRSRLRRRRWQRSQQC